MDASLKEINLWKSIKRFWKEGLDGTSKVYFDKFFDTKRRADRWVGVELSGVRPDQVSQAFMKIYIYSRKDHEGDELVTLRDSVMELIEPSFFTLYDTSLDPWESIGGVQIIEVNQSPIQNMPDGVKMKLIQTLIKWSAVW